MYLLLTLIDLLLAITLIFAHFGVVANKLLSYFVMYLIAKGLWYRKDWMSWIDIAIGIYIWFWIIGKGVSNGFTWFAIIYFIYKGIIYWFYEGTG